MSDVRVHDRSDGVVVEVLDDVVPQETAAGDDAEADPCLLQRRHDALPVDVEPGVEDDRKREPRASRTLQLALNDEPLVSLEERLEQRGIVAAD